MSAAGLLAISVVVCVFLFGWGTITPRLAKYPVGDSVVTMIVGLSALVFLGNILNLIRSCSSGAMG